MKDVDPKNLSRSQVLKLRKEVSAARDRDAERRAEMESHVAKAWRYARQKLRRRGIQKGTLEEKIYLSTMELVILSDQESKLDFWKPKAMRRVIDEALFVTPRIMKDVSLLKVS